jgi:hypothetical protein
MVKRLEVLKIYEKHYGREVPEIETGAEAFARRSS